MQSSADLAFPFRQDSNFLYLTGLQTPDAVLVIDCDDGVSTLFLREHNSYQDEWDGEDNEERIKEISGVDVIKPRAELADLLADAKKRGKSIGYLPPIGDDEGRVEPYGFYANPARRMLQQQLLEAGFTKDELVDIREDIARLRQVKQQHELAAIKQAIDVTADSLKIVKENLSSLKTEKDVERLLLSQFYANGADGEAFGSIIAGGKNAATIHYVDNDAPLKKDELLLLDVGAKVDGYAADISRTWSIGGKSSQRQKDVWNACLDIQQYAFSKLKAGVILRDYQKDVEFYAQKVCKKLKCSMADKPFPHGFSHHLGLDVHDAGLYGEPLPENAVITVEPGIYLPDEGIGVRVEDNILITKTGYKNLSAHIPKTL